MPVRKMTRPPTKDPWTHFCAAEQGERVMVAIGEDPEPTDDETRCGKRIWPEQHPTAITMGPSITGDESHVTCPECRQKGLER